MASHQSWDTYASARAAAGRPAGRGPGAEFPPVTLPLAAIEPPPHGHGPPELATHFVQQAAPASGMVLHTPRVQSCQFCRRRKIKCDKTMPSCLNCVKAKSACVYPKRKGRVKTSVVRKVGEELSGREEKLLRRLRELEGVIEELRGGKEGEGNDGRDQEEKELAGAEGTGQNQLCDPLTKLVVGQPYLNEEFWRSNELKDILDDSSDEMESEYEDFPIAGNSPRGVDFVFGVGPIYDDLSMFHPPISQVMHYWYLYLENCECLLRLIHTPTFTPIIQSAVRNSFRDLSKSDELLIFTIYFASVTSLADKEALHQFGEEREALLARYELAIKYGLTRSRFLHTQDFKVLQALVLYLTCIPNVNSIVSAVVWNMIGLALRIAQSMSVDRDGEILKLSPFETELRRRLWYHLLFLDIRGSEARGCFSTVLQYDTRLPTNLNDSDLTPSMTEYAKPRNELTDMTVPLQRLESARLGRRLQATGFRDAMLSPPMKRKLIERVQQELDDKYSKYCVGAGPLYEYSSKVATMITTRANLAVYADKIASAPQADKDWMLRICIEIMEFYYELSNASNTGRKWSWLLKIHVQWHAVAFTLKELIERSPSEDTERAWCIIDKSAHEWQPPQDEKGTLVYESVKKLLAKAQKKRERRAPRSGDNSTSPDSVDSNLYTGTSSSTVPQAGINAGVSNTPPIHSQGTTNPPQIAQPPQPQPQMRIPQVEQVPYDYYFEISDPALSTFQTGSATFQPDATFQASGVDPSFGDHYVPSFDAHMSIGPAPASNAVLPEWYFGHAVSGPGVTGSMMTAGQVHMTAQTHVQGYNEYDMGMAPGVAMDIGRGLGSGNVSAPRGGGKGIGNRNRNSNKNQDNNGGRSGA